MVNVVGMPFSIASSISRVKHPWMSKNTRRSSWVLVTIISDKVASTAWSGEGDDHRREKSRNNKKMSEWRRSKDMIRCLCARRQRGFNWPKGSFPIPSCSLNHYTLTVFVFPSRSKVKPPREICEETPNFL
jgi:hypothetical protein